MEALFYEPIGDKKVHCFLCPHDCKIIPEKFGVCGVRQNINGKLFTHIYGKVSSIANDPIEKKPLYHFHPGTMVMSVGTIGCNMKCGHCQNWTISHITAKDSISLQTISPKELVQIAIQNKSAGIAWTYNEPTIWFEYCLDGAKLAKKRGLYTVWVTNGYINIPPLDMIGPYLDAYRVDIKAFNNDVYRKLCKIPDFKPVLESAVRAKKKWNMHVEIVTNIIPTINDDDKQLKHIAGWISNSLGPETPWHVTRFFPYLDYKHLPPTPIETLKRAKEIGLAAGLKNIHIGNV